MSGMSGMSGTHHHAASTPGTQHETPATEPGEERPLVRPAVLDPGEHAGDFTPGSAAHEPGPRT